MQEGHWLESTITNVGLAAPGEDPGSFTESPIFISGRVAGSGLRLNTKLRVAAAASNRKETAIAAAAVFSMRVKTFVAS